MKSHFPLSVTRFSRSRRADKPQKGRYREFFQCDVDVIGSSSLLNEVELVQIINDIFKKLGIKNTIKLNNRKVLYGIAEIWEKQIISQRITVAIDKLDKIGFENVISELSGIGILQMMVFKKLKKILEFQETTMIK